MKRVLSTLLWIKFFAVILMFGLSFAFNFLILSKKIESETAFYLLLFGKPALILLYLFVQNFIFKFPGKIHVPMLIPSTFLILSILIFVDIGFLIYKYFEIFTKNQLLWGIYGVVIIFCLINLRKFYKAFFTEKGV
jgi:hypothetical protein